MALFTLLASAFIIDDFQLKALLFRFEKLKQNYPQEKVHLHFDKPYYSVGDTIYFKAYVVNAEKNHPSDISNMLNIDLIREDSIIEKSILLPLWDGVAWGSLALEDTLHEGSYRIRAYTNWMRNFDAAYFFDKAISIGDAFNNDLNASVDIKQDSSNKQKNITAVTYTSFGGSPVSGKEVTYSIIVKSKEVLKGKAVTDSSGKINISLGTGNISGKLVTHIKIGTKTSVVKSLNFETKFPEPAIQFFPEGGGLLYSDHCRIAFKATGVNGLGTNVSGDIVDGNGKRITGFQSGFAGIGSFELTPFTGNEYFAVVKFTDGHIQKIALPKPSENGYGLYINNSDDDEVGISISAHVNSLPSEVLLVAQTHNVISYMAKTTLGSAGFKGNVSKKKFSTGITQFTLFNASMQPVAERLIFVDHHDQLRVNLTTDKVTYSKREKVKLDLEAMDEDDNPVTGSFSVAVTNVTKVPFDEVTEQSILSDLLLTSDIRGYIENPNYYFTNTDAKKVKALDDLLLTQGWRRFIWNDLMADKFPSLQYKAEKSLAISGRVSSLDDMPLEGAKVSIISKKGTGFTMDTVTNAEGRFKFDELDLQDDSITYVVNATDAKGSNDVKIKMDSSVAPQVMVKTGEPFAGTKFSSVMLTYLKNSNDQFIEMRKHGLLKNNTSTLKEVVVKTKTLTKIQEAVAPSANLNGPGNADQVLTYMDLNNCATLAACLPGKIRGVYLKKVFDVETKTWATLAFSSIGFDAPMLIIVDGMEMNAFHGGSSIDNIVPTDIQSIEVLRSGAYLSTYGTRASGGVLVITTKHGGIDYNANLYGKEDIQHLKGVLFTSSKAYHTSREFYSPDYNNPKTNLTLPDLRSTVFWKPDIITDEYGKATVTFYNTDATGEYRVVLEGLSENGKFVRKVYYYTVQ